MASGLASIAFTCGRSISLGASALIAGVRTAEGPNGRFTRAAAFTPNGRGGAVACQVLQATIQRGPSLAPTRGLCRRVASSKGGPLL